jgi:Transposase IS66 family
LPSLCSTKHELGSPTADEEAKQPHKWEQRVREYRRLVEGVAKLGAQYADAKEYGQHGGGKHDKNGQEQSKHPCHTLCKRLLRHQEELFQFVLVPGLSSDNNLAERSIRPVPVVMRKVSGGTQSPRGSATRMVLASLFGTWRAKALNPFDQCLALLSQPSHP